MASVRQRGKKKAWHALFRDAKGKLVERATKAKTRREAQETAEKFERLARLSPEMQTVRQVTSVLKDLHLKALGRDLPQMTMRSFASYWLDTRETEVSPATIWFYQHAVSLFLKWLGPRADADLFSISREDVVRFRDAEAKSVQPRTVNHNVNVLRMLFRQAVADGWTPENPAGHVKPVRLVSTERRSPKRPLSIEELGRLLAVADGEWRGMIVRGYYTGQRLKDIALMRLGDEDPLRGVVKFVTSKTGKRMLVQMHPAYLDFVLEQKTGDDPAAMLHTRAAAAVQRCNGATSTLSNQFHRLLAKAGIVQPRPSQKRKDGPGRAGRRQMGELGFHSLRHSFVSHLKDAGVPPQFVEEMVGHDDSAMNLIYTRLDPVVARREVAKLPDILAPQSVA
ncbi:MAG: tyrosine-type recombinase/integrase [Verrucomicrobiaceae bacterium]|nr:tyrosine-type recombinase/integrase [Verrucomicrobiaceae bacterium]